MTSSVVMLSIAFGLRATCGHWMIWVPFFVLASGTLRFQPLCLAAQACPPLRALSGEMTTSSVQRWPVRLA